MRMIMATFCTIDEIYGGKKENPLMREKNKFCEIKYYLAVKREEYIKIYTILLHLN